MAQQLRETTAPYDPFAGLRIKDDHLRSVLEGKAFLIQDGAMGTLLQASGAQLPKPVPDLINLTQPQLVTGLHKRYVDVGVEMVITNTFNTNRRKLQGAATVAEVYAAAAENVRAAGARYIAGDVGPTGALMEPMGDLSFPQAYDLFAEQARAAEDAGCDLVMIETMSNLAEAKAAVLAARENTALPVFVSMTYEEDGRTFLGTPPEVAATVLSGAGAHVVGVNCSLGPAEVLPVVRKLLQYSCVPVMVRPNAGLPRLEGETTVYDVTPQDFGAAMEAIVAAGATVLGGCCGTNPDFIRETVAIVQRTGAPAPRTLPQAFTLASQTRLFSLPAGSPAVGVVGERINPTGKPKLKAALREGNLDYLVGEALGQEERGADVLDVNVGLPELDEPAVLQAAVKKLSQTSTLPLVIDSSDPAAVEAAVRSYAGKPLINSVNGKQESLRTVLPLAAKYGCAVIGLTLDEEGIPPTAEGRFAIAQRIVEQAEACGIPRCDVVIDCLTMAVATNQAEAPEILRAIRMVKERLGCRTTLGVSNISFGLPQRPLMNATFLAAAFGAGLDLPILNPNDARYRDVVASYRVLNAQDTGARAYIERCETTPDPYASAAQALTQVARSQVAEGLALIAQATGCSAGGSGTVAPGASAAEPRLSQAAKAPATPEGEAPLPVPESLAGSYSLVVQAQDLILSGRKEPLAQATRKLLESHSALDIIDGLFIPALDEVGERFDKGRYFLPQLMASAEAVKAGFDVVKEQAAAGGEEKAQPAEGKPVILATVKGDIHDIGKNIVKMLLENYGFSVVDLGRDVAPQQVVDACKSQGIRLVGLSALMTTTCKAMEETIRLLAEEVPDAQTFVGGAVVTPEYAQSIGATYYTKDAAASARVAEQYYAGK